MAVSNSSWTSVLNNIPLVEHASGQLLHRDIVTDLHAMQDTAFKDGVSIDIASSYRAVDRQLAIWNAKWKGNRPLLARDGSPLDVESLTDERKLKAILTWSALPGASRHHWGSDLDVYDKPKVDEIGHTLELIPTEYQSGGPCAELSQWLQEHMPNFGFFRPYETDKGGIACEPWHISHQATAQTLEKELTLTALTEFINSIEIAGKSVILDNLHWIFPAYVQNHGF